MNNIIFVSDIVEKNGKTIKENNLERQHKFKIGDLVEIYSEVDEDYRYHGVRLYICDYRRDCDGSPLYSLGPKEWHDRSELNHGHGEEGMKLVK